MTASPRRRPLRAVAAALLVVVVCAVGITGGLLLSARSAGVPSSLSIAGQGNLGGTPEAPVDDTTDLVHHKVCDAYAGGYLCTELTRVELGRLTLGPRGSTSVPRVAVPRCVGATFSNSGTAPFALELRPSTTFVQLAVVDGNTGLTPTLGVAATALAGCASRAAPARLIVEPGQRRSVTLAFEGHAPLAFGRTLPLASVAWEMLSVGGLADWSNVAVPSSFLTDTLVRAFPPKCTTWCSIVGEVSSPGVENANLDVCCTGDLPPFGSSNLPAIRGLEPADRVVWTFFAEPGNTPIVSIDHLWRAPAQVRPRPDASHVVFYVSEMRVGGVAVRSRVDAGSAFLDVVTSCTPSGCDLYRVGPSGSAAGPAACRAAGAACVSFVVPRGSRILGVGGLSTLALLGSTEFPRMAPFVAVETLRLRRTR